MPHTEKQNLAVLLKVISSSSALHLSQILGWLVDLVTIHSDIRDAAGNYKFDGVRDMT